MQDNERQSLSIMKRVLIGMGCLVLVLGIGIGTAFVLKNVIPKKDTQLASSNWQPAEVVLAYTVPGAIHGLADSLYYSQLGNGTDATIQYKAAGRDYAVGASTKDHALFYARDTSNHDDVKAVQDQTAVFMHVKGYDKVDGVQKATKDGPFYATYASSSAICQLTSSGPVAQAATPVSHMLACMEKTAVDQEYGTVETLLALYNKAGGLRPTFSSVTRTLLKENDKSMSILSLKTSQKPPLLLFAAVGSEWTYIGNLNSENGQANSKYVITPDIQKKASDSKYGDFLLKNIQGGVTQDATLVTGS